MGVTRGLSRRQLIGGVVVAGLSARRALAAAKDTLVVGLENYPPNLKPFEHTGSASGTVKLLMYRGLLSHTATGALQPELAESWHVENGTDYIFTLRENARFQNGLPVTADDVVYSFGMIRTDPTARINSTMKLVDTMAALDPRTVRLRLHQPTAPFAEALGNLNCVVISAKAHAANATDYVGAGPYRLVSQDRGSTIELTAFPDFYKPGRPKLPHVKVIAYTDDNLRATALRAGDADLIEDLPWEDIEPASHDPRLNVQSVNGAFMFMGFNVNKGPFADARVRRAVALAVNRQDVLKGAFSGKGAALYGLPIPEDSRFYDKDSAIQWPYDPAQAKRLLAEAGFPSGFSTSLLTTTSPQMHADTSVVVQQSLAAIGIQVALQTTDWTTRVARGNKGDYEMAMNGTAPDYNDPDALSTLLATGPLTYQRSAGFSSPRIDALLAQGRSELDPGKRQQTYAMLSRQAGEDTPTVFLNWRAQAFGLQKSVQGFHNFPGFLTFHSGQTIEDINFG